MNNDFNNCTQCEEWRILFNNKVKKVEELKKEIQRLTKLLQCYQVKSCNTCYCNKNKNDINNSDFTDSHEKISQDKIGLKKVFKENSKYDLFSPESKEDISNETTETEEIEVLKESISSSTVQSSEDYIYDENMKMYYCVSTGYYYDKTTGLYYVPQNRAYYSYDYSANAYVLYSDTNDSSTPALTSSTENKENEEISKQLEFDCNKAKIEESCESVVSQVNNLNISDRIDENSHSNDVEQVDIIEKSKQVDLSDDNEKYEVTKDWQTPAGTNLTIQDLVREVAEQQSGMSDYIYDENSKMYYSPSTGYYYDAVKNLLYDPTSGSYYKYDQETSSYEFYCSIDLQQVATALNNKSKLENQSKKMKARRRYWREKQESSEKPSNKLEKDSCSEEESFSSPEEGELFSSDSEEEELQSHQTSPPEESSSSYAPCIRAIVKNSEKLKIGTLILITCTGATVGKDKSNLVYIPDVGVSKLHAEIKFDEKINKYSIRDLGSQNGTFINDSRLSQPKEESDIHILNHDDCVSIGSCKLMFHIHVGHETCNDCEPGQILAELSSQEELPAVKFKTKEEIEKERRQEVRRLKKKYGLQGMNYEENKQSSVSNKSKYEDKAETRRKLVGSDNPHEKTEASSLEQMMSETNKGYQMLKRLGWKEGSALGATEKGISEPIPFRPWLSKAGLGSCEEQQAASQNLPLDKRNKKWIKAQERFLQLS